MLLDEIHKICIVACTSTFLKFLDEGVEQLCLAVVASETVGGSFKTVTQRYYVNEEIYRTLCVVETPWIASCAIMLFVMTEGYVAVSSQ